MELTTEDVYSFLMNTAKKGTELPVIDRNDIQKKATRKELRNAGYIYSYGDILVECGLKSNDRVGLNNLFVILDEINIESKKREDILLSSLVVTTTNDRLIPSDRYFEKWHGIDPKNQTENDLIYLWWDDVTKMYPLVA